MYQLFGCQGNMKQVGLPNIIVDDLQMVPLPLNYESSMAQLETLLSAFLQLDMEQLKEGGGAKTCLLRSHCHALCFRTFVWVLGCGSHSNRSCFDFNHV